MQIHSDQVSNNPSDCLSYIYDDDRIRLFIDTQEDNMKSIVQTQRQIQSQMNKRSGPSKHTVIKSQQQQLETYISQSMLTKDSNQQQDKFEKSLEKTKQLIQQHGDFFDDSTDLECQVNMSTLYTKSQYQQSQTLSITELLQKINQTQNITPEQETAFYNKSISYLIILDNIINQLEKQEKNVMSPAELQNIQNEIGNVMRLKSTIQQLINTELTKNIELVKYKKWQTLDLDKYVYDQGYQLRQKFNLSNVQKQMSIVDKAIYDLPSTRNINQLRRDMEYQTQITQLQEQCVDNIRNCQNNNIGELFMDEQNHKKDQQLKKCFEQNQLYGNQSKIAFFKNKNVFPVKVPDYFHKIVQNNIYSITYQQLSFAANLQIGGSQPLQQKIVDKILFQQFKLNNRRPNSFEANLIYGFVSYLLQQTPQIILSIKIQNNLIQDIYYYIPLIKKPGFVHLVVDLKFSVQVKQHNVGNIAIPYIDNQICLLKANSSKVYNNMYRKIEFDFTEIKNAVMNILHQIKKEIK